MRFLLKAGIIFLNIVYFFIKLFPIRNKIAFISRQSNKPNIDFELLGNKLEKNYKVVYLCKKLEKGVFNKIKYFFHMFKQMYHISTSKVVVLDSYCIPVGILKHKKGVKIVQMWHALGAFKKFGKSILDKDESNANVGEVKGISANDLSEIMGMHKNYDYIFSSSEESCIGFSEAFGYPRNKFKIYPLPRLDLIVNKDNQEKVKKKIYSKYKQLKNKENILYCPTFRKDDSDIDHIKELINKIDYKKYNLILKLHPLTKLEVNDDRVVYDKSFNTYEMAFVSDYIITDYSAVIYEVSQLKKPIFIYAYDRDTYINKRDFYLNFDKDMPGEIFTDIDKLLDKINNKDYSLSKIDRFNSRYVNKYKVSYTDDIVKFIESLMDEEK